MLSTATRKLLHRVKDELIQLDATGAGNHERMERLVADLERQLLDTGKPDGKKAPDASPGVEGACLDRPHETVDSHRQAEHPLPRLTKTRAESIAEQSEKVVEMKNISIAFGGIKAVDNVSIDLHRGEVVGLVGHNGAGKTVLIKILSGALRRDQGEIYIRGKEARINKPIDARKYGIETIYQTLALADNVDAAGNLFLGRELITKAHTLDDLNMESRSRKVMHRLNPRFRRFKEPVRALSGGQRQSVAIARAILFDAQILIMDEPMAALGPHEAGQVGDLIKQLKSEGISIFLISHDMHDVFDLADRVVVMKNGQIVGTAHTDEVTQDEVLGMIILGKCPANAISGPGAVNVE